MVIAVNVICILVEFLKVGIKKGQDAVKRDRSTASHSDGDTPL